MKNKSWLTSKIEKFSKEEDYILEKNILKITEQISIRLHELGLSKKDLAGRMHVSQAHITKLLNGKNNFTLKTLVKISKLLDVELNIEMSNQEEHTTEWFDSVSLNSFDDITMDFGTKTVWLTPGQISYQAVVTHNISKTLIANNNYQEYN